MARRRTIPFEIPGTIRIRGRVWPILREHDLGDSWFDRAARRELKQSLGVTYYPTPTTPDEPREIHLRRHKRRIEAQTFIHELLHACSRQKISAKLEEKFIRDVEVALLHALEQLRWRCEHRCPFCGAPLDTNARCPATLSALRRRLRSQRR